MTTMRFANLPLILAAAHGGDASSRAASGSGGGVLRWLLGLKELDPTNPNLLISFQHTIPSWAWVAIITAAAVIAGMSYRYMVGRRGGRITLAAVRAAVLLLIIVLLAQPSLVLPDEEIEQDHVLMLVDRSASVSVKDVFDAQNAADRTSRQQQLQSIITSHDPLWDKLAKQHHVDWLGFSDRLVELGSPDKLEAPGGRSTALRSAILEALRRSAGKPISAMVVMSDGRSSEPIGPDTWRMLRQMGVPVYAVPLGAPKAPLDLAIGRTDAPDRAFVNDTVPIGVSITRTGESADATDRAPPGTIVKLVDTTTGQVLDQKPVERYDKPVQLMTTPKAAGAVTWRVELSTSEPELITENNQQNLELTLVDRPIRLLYVEGYPRWEYRYLKNMVVREASVSSSIMLLSADRTFAQEGNIPLKRLPRTEEEMKPYDVIIIGDVPAGFFSADQLRLIEQQVSVRGAGLMWIGGAYDTPGSYATSPLASLLPMGGAMSSALLPTPIKLMPTPMAEALGVLRLRSLSGPDADTTWPENLPVLQWAQSIESLKPAAEALAVDANSNQPLIVRMRFGAGQSLYVATDEIWRWRYGRGDLYPEQFWMQLLRLLARGRLQSGSGSDDRATLIVSHRRAATGDTLVVELNINDQALLEQQPSTIAVDVTEVAGEKDPAPRPGSTPTQRITLTASPDRKGHYQGLWTPPAAGRMALRVVEPTLADLGLTQIVQVDRADAELRYPAADHALLGELAQRSGGTVLAASQVDDLERLLPNNARHTVTDISEPLWNSPLAFILVLLLISGEWIGRRLIGLA
ncbi:MAG: hypothetical protein GC162_13725 [Planctomycetes bacterium]|nr:hypothetical protein [Planctomycetota bacterium]